MIHYFLEGWQRELDAKVALEWEKLVMDSQKYFRPEVERRLQYELIGFMKEKLSIGDFVPSFEPFCVAYIKSKISDCCNGFEVYKFDRYGGSGDGGR